MAAMSSGMRIPRLVAAVALVDDLDMPTRVLAARRTAPPALAGRWEFPGGKVEPGESAEMAAVREVAEELGSQVVLGDPIGTTWPLVPGLVMRLWWAVLAGGSDLPRPLQDHDEVRWLTGQRIRQVPWLESNVAIVEHVAGLLHTPHRD